MSWIFRAVLILTPFTGAASAQETTAPAEHIFAPGLVAPTMDFVMEPPGEALAPVPYAPSIDGNALAPLLVRQHDLVLQARLVPEGEPLSSGVVWRVFGVQPDTEGRLPLIEEGRGGAMTVQLAAGEYLLHAAFGHAGVAKRITIADDDQMESIVFNAGGLRLDAVVDEDRPIPQESVTFEVLQEDETGEFITIVPNATPGRVLRLSAGTYHVDSHYGNVNATVRADIEVEPGKLTEVVMRHSAAEVTLKLVSIEGGEALANTSWAVTTQDGTTVHESIGAFPTLILAAGSYTAVATHQEDIYSRDFMVEAGIDRDIEVRLSDLIQPETGQAIGAELPSVGIQP
jgi:hypothetical protein